MANIFNVPKLDGIKLSQRIFLDHLDIRDEDYVAGIIQGAREDPAQITLKASRCQELKDFIVQARAIFRSKAVGPDRILTTTIRGSDNEGILLGIPEGHYPQEPASLVVRIWKEKEDDPISETPGATLMDLEVTIIDCESHSGLIKKQYFSKPITL